MGAAVHARPAHQDAASLPLAAAIVLGLLAAAPAFGQGADPACDPDVEQALVAASAAGVEAEIAVVRDEAAGIRAPASILDVSCLERMFNYRNYDVHFNPQGALTELLGLANRTVCQHAERVYRQQIGRRADLADLWGGGGIPRVPGLSTRPRLGNILDDAGAPRGDTLGIVR